MWCNHLCSWRDSPWHGGGKKQEFVSYRPPASNLLHVCRWFQRVCLNHVQITENVRKSHTERVLYTLFWLSYLIFNHCHDLLQWFEVRPKFWDYLHVHTSLLPWRPTSTFIIYDGSFECPRGVTHLPPPSPEASRMLHQFLRQARALLPSQRRFCTSLRFADGVCTMQCEIDTQPLALPAPDRPMQLNPAQPRTDPPRRDAPHRPIDFPSFHCNVFVANTCYMHVISSIFNVMDGHVISGFGNFEIMLICLPCVCLLGRDAVGR
jgi:hypothetical protein